MQYVIEKEKKLCISDTCNVLIAGGGIAGVSAALAAARRGLDVLLVEREYMVGGLGTIGLIAIYLPICDGEGQQVCYGIAEELLQLAATTCCEGMFPKAWIRSNATVEERRNGQRFMVQYNPFLYALELEHKLRESGVRLLYGTGIHDVIMDGSYIRGVVVENKSGRSVIRTDSVIDCTGDADICSFAGASVRVYEPQNPLACWYNYLEDGKFCLNQFGAADRTDEDPNHEYKNIGSLRVSGVDAKENSAYVIAGHEKVYEEIARNKKNGQHTNISSLAAIPNFRMTRCLCGETAVDFPKDKETCPDCVGLFPDWTRRGPVYALPFSALYNKSVRNLLTAGRCISATDDMWNVSRAIPVCAVSGEAAGTAFSICFDIENIDIRELQDRLHSKNVRTAIEQIER